MRPHLLTHLLVLAGGLALAMGCSSRPSGPKDAVIAVFGAMEKNDKATLAHLLDLAALMQNLNDDYALQKDAPRRFTNPEQILDDLTGAGETKKRWFSLQRIIDKVEINGAEATVDVTFVDKQASRGYQTKFALHVVNDRWKVYSFNAYPMSS